MRMGLIGATGLVGTEMLRILEERDVPARGAARVRVVALGRARACRSRAARWCARRSATVASTASTW